LIEAASLCGERTALIEAHPNPAQRRRWTYAQLLSEASVIANALAEKCEPGSHIAVWASNRPEWVMLQFGLALAGMVMVTVNPALQPRELAYVLAQSEARAIFHDEDHRGRSMSDAIAEARALEPLRLDWVASLDDIVRFGATSSPRPLPSVSPSDAAMIQYTSGTSGKPKGVMLSHRSVTNNARIMALLKDHGSETINLAVAPLFHAGGCVGGVLATVQTHGTILLPRAFDADFMLDLIEQERATYTFAVPTMLIALLEAQSRRRRDVSSLRTIFSGGTVVPAEIVRRVEESLGTRLIIGYGLTETSPAITHTRLDDSPEDKGGTIGKPIPQVEVRIVDPHTNATLPTGTPGELCTRGFHVMLGYYNMPAATAQCIDSDGWLHTGDLCSMDTRGYCRVHGRIKDMIIRGGENVYPREIEDVLYAHPAIAEVAVIGVPSDYWGEEVAAIFTYRPGKSATAQDLQEFLTGRLARYKVPRYWYAVTALPMTASGKLQKFRLAQTVRDGELECFRLT
jgi:fatty-acyl-CoA synthase